MMNTMGAIDRIVPPLLALTVGVLILMGELTGTAAIILAGFGGVYLLTSAASGCPLSLPFGFSSM